MTESPEIRRKRLLFRSHHRGTKESDLLLGAFADAHLAAMTEAQLENYERLLDTADATIFDWVAGRRKPEPAEETDVVRMRLSFRYRTARA